jgi:hypothetical protein
MEKTIFNQKVVALTFGPGSDLCVNVLAVEDLRCQNRGRGRFVRSVLEAVIAGRAYDDSDPDAHRGKSAFVFYLPYSGLAINGVPLPEDLERCPTCGGLHQVCPRCGERRVICPPAEPGVPFSWCEQCETNRQAALQAENRLAQRQMEAVRGGA